MLVVVAPGQGAQQPGFLSPWMEDPVFAERMDWLSAVASMDLGHFGTKADQDTIRDTAVAQPLLVAAGLVSAVSLFPHPRGAFDAVGAASGHSVGEITAAAGVGVISAEQAMVLVRERGKAMADAARRTQTSMTAVLGGDRDEVLAALGRHGLTAANDNGPGQIVAAGTVEQLAALAEAVAAGEGPAKTRLTPLSVAGAFHTEHMSPAVEVLGGFARAVTTHDPRTALISNRDGHVVHDGHQVLQRIVAQVASPIRWDLCMQSMRDLGATGLLEVPPAGTLTGIARRALPDVATFALKTPNQLDDARAFAGEHAVASPLDTAPTWRLLVAPAKGTFEKAPAVDSEQPLRPRERVGTLRGRSDEIAVVAPHGGTVVEWLVEDGDPVAPGQPLVRLHPEGTA